MKTIAELEKYLEEECYSFYAITIGKHMAPEGFVIKQDGQEYIYGYSERGFLRTIKASESGEELVNYALKDLASYKWNRAHLVARMWSEYDAAEAERELSRMHIAFERNDVHNCDMEHRRLCRIFVFGRDILRLSDFKRKYIQDP